MVLTIVPRTNLLVVVEYSRAVTWLTLTWLGSAVTYVRAEVGGAYVFASDYYCRICLRLEPCVLLLISRHHGSEVLAPYSTQLIASRGH